MLIQGYGYVNIILSMLLLMFSLKALVAVYIRGNIPLAGGSTLKVISEAISIFKDDVQFAAINTELETRQRTIQGASSVDTAQNPPSPTWREKIQAVVDHLMFPDQAIWTDEEEDSTDLDFAQHCLNKIKLRYERYIDLFIFFVGIC